MKTSKDHQSMSSIVIGNVKGNELPLGWQKKLNVKSYECFNINITVDRIEEGDEIENIGEVLIEGFKELLEIKEKGIKPQSAREFINSH
jgi:hypothetical protein